MVCSIVKLSFLKCRGDKSNGPDASLDMTEPLRPAVQAMVVPTLVSTSPPEVYKTMLNKAKKEHDLAKAVKADDAQVPVYSWTKQCVGESLWTESRKPCPSFVLSS
jgi:hypothetical protein